MELEKTPLYDDIQLILKSGPKPVHFSWRAEIIANKKTTPITQILSIDVVQDYELNYSDEIILIAAIPLGTFVKYIYPFRDNLEITLYKVPLKEGIDISNVDELTETETYVATLLNGTNVVAEATGINLLSIESMNLASIPTIHFQLINKAVHKLRLINIGGIYRNQTTGDAIKAILTNESMKIKVAEERKTVGVSMVPADNTAKRDHIKLPDGLSLVDMPQYIHEKCGGVYNAGLSYYYQDNFWYVYPCYNPTRYNSEVRTLTVINIPPNKYPNIERTYNKVGNNLTILATGEAKFRDFSNNVQLSLGNGFMYADATQYMGGFVNVENNKATASRKENISEYTTEKRKDGINNVQLSSSQITSNPFVEHSILAKRQGSIFSFVWENSNPSLIFPGMMVKIMYQDRDGAKVIYGSTLKMHHFTQLKGMGVTANRHTTNTVMVFFVKAIEGKDEQ